MAKILRAIGQAFSKTRKKLTKFDAFGIPITVNYKGEDKYKTFFGFLCTLALFAVMAGFIYEGLQRLLLREDPDRSSFKLTNSRPKEDALNLPSYEGQMYIGLRQKVEFKDGTSITSFIDFDPRYINGKIDYYEKRRLEARKNLELCAEAEKDDFEARVENTNGVNMADFLVMRCIPRDTFNFYNVAGTTEANSISLIFEQCGGKYAKSKEFQAVLEQQIEEAIANGADPSTLPDAAEEWQWTDPYCDPSEENCALPGLAETPEEVAAIEEKRDVYEDCDPNADPADVDCIETWVFPSNCADLGHFECFKKMTEPPTCTEGDTNCYVGFLRAMCADI